MNKNTTKQFAEIIDYCLNIFETKQKDYSTAWRILRTTSLTDQIYIKANRIRSIQISGVSKVDEGIVPEFVGIVNYSVMALIQLELGFAEEADLGAEKAVLLRIKQIEDNDGKTIASEGLGANYDDIINYSIFALIKLIIAKENG